MNKTDVRTALLTVLAKVPVPVTRSGPSPRILLIRPDHLGDLLFMTPALHALRAAQPTTHLACLIGHVSRQTGGMKHFAVRNHGIAAPMVGPKFTHPGGVIGG